ncbi:MAG: DUF1016 family protein [Bacteroidetes bacterium]|nr:DUF1016 family protein [Bacteroidota bacterium]MCW5894976.1 DUF1016 family protein [Bacteroidota bacterium]
MKKTPRSQRRPPSRTRVPDYATILSRLVALFEQARHTAARSVNAVMTATYWEMGRHIVEFEQKGKERALYGEQLLERLASDLTRRFKRGFSLRNIRNFRAFYLTYPIRQTVSAEFRNLAPSAGTSLLPAIRQTASAESVPHIRQRVSGKSVTLELLAENFPLPWSHYVALLSVEKQDARQFYEIEALRGGWSVRQLERQIATLFYERTLMSRNKTAMLLKGAKRNASESVTPDEEFKDPLVLEFLGLKDEYSENDLEDALTNRLESFLLELGNDFSFIGRQRRLRIGHKWYRIDLLLFHRLLRCLVIVDLKLGELTHSDTGQMKMYLNYARTHWMHEHENPPVGLILTSHHDHALAQYAFDTVTDRILAREYKLRLPREAVLAAELARAQRVIARRFPLKHRKRKR